MKHRLKKGDFIIDEIESIELVGDLPTIDIEVEKTHMFFANDIYVHNSGSSTEFISGEQIAEDYSKIMTGDFIFSITRKIEDAMHKTARIFIIKNRFGVDKIICPAKFDVSNGNSVIHDPSSLLGKETKGQMNKDDNIKSLIRERLFSDKKRKK